MPWLIGSPASVFAAASISLIARLVIHDSRHGDRNRAGAQIRGEVSNSHLHTSMAATFSEIVAEINARGV